MGYQVEKLVHLRHILLFAFNRGAKAAEAARNIFAIEKSVTRKWFSRFKENRFTISDTPRSERPSGFEENRLNTLIHIDPRHCIQ